MGIGTSPARSAANPRHPRRSEAKPDIDGLRERYRANPSNPDVALQFGKALRESGQRAQAVAVLEQAVLVHSANKALLAA